MLKPLENKLAEVFKKGPQMPDSAKKSLATQWYPWIALIFGVLQLFAVWALWRVGHRANGLVDYANELSRAFGGNDVVPKLGIFYWVSMIVLAVDAVVLLMAYPALKAHKKAGWDWLFLGAVVNLAYGVVSIFVDDYYGGGVGRFLGSLVGTAVGFWLLFQARDYYVNHKKAE